MQVSLEMFAILRSNFPTVLWIEYLLIEYYSWFNYNLDRITTHSKFQLTGARIHDLHIMDSIFRPSGTFMPETKLCQTFYDRI